MVERRKEKEKEKERKRGIEEYFGREKEREREREKERSTLVKRKKDKEREGILCKRERKRLVIFKSINQFSPVRPTVSLRTDTTAIVVDKETKRHQLKVYQKNKKTKTKRHKASFCFLVL